jgi:single-stranded-DNA-specific exonuclease
MLIRQIQRKQHVTPAPDLSIFPEKIQQILASRNITELAQLDYALKGLLPPSDLKDIDKATEYLFRAIKSKHSILIIGDFDADGATSSAIMIKALKLLGATKVNFLVPDRFQYGYGLSVKLVEYAKTLAPDLIITVDNGIANVDGVARANELGMPVIITDHHLAPDVLPDAVAIVNPNQPNDNFKSKHIAGVGVAFYLMLSLRALMRSNGWFASQSIDEPNLAELLDIVALGTVADVVVLDKNNRILVEQGLKRIRSGKACAGISAILQVANRDPFKCQASDLGFAVGPRLNAAGRLESMSIGIQCLLAESHNEAMALAQKLDRLNRERRDIEQDMLQQAELDLTAYFKHANFEEANSEQANSEQAKVTASNQSQPNGDTLSTSTSTSTSTSASVSSSIADNRPTTLCLYDPEWHQGVIGILASRVKDKINRPVIVFAKDDDQGVMIKGSARSIKGVHIRDALVYVDVKYPNMIEKFGGHAMAAGLSIKQIDFELFSQALQLAVDVQLNGESIKDSIETDAGLGQAELCLDFAHQLQQVGPWGQGFVEPLFDDVFTVVTSRIVGEDHLKLVVEKEGVAVDAIYFRCPENLRAKPEQSVHLVYKLSVNEFRGNQTLQLMVEQLAIV